jgi:hypothetical protein
MDRIAAIKESLATWVCGLLSFFPIIGVIPAVYAIANWRHLRRYCQLEWNPGDHYLRWGAILAIWNLIFTVCALVAAAAWWIERYLE